MNSFNIKKIFNYIAKKKYLITLFVFIFWLMFFDKNSIISRMKDANKYKKLLHEKEFYQEKIYTDSIKLEQLKTNDKNLEKFGREEYLMHKPNEDIFQIKEEE